MPAIAALGVLVSTGAGAEGMRHGLGLCIVNSSPGLNAVIVARADSNIRGLADLDGKVVAPEHPEPTSPYHPPITLLRRAGLDLVERRRGVPGKVACYSSRGDKNTEALEKMLLAPGDDEDATARGLGRDASSY